MTRNIVSPPGKYPWQELFKYPKALIFFMTLPFQNLGLKVFPSTEYCAMLSPQQTDSCPPNRLILCCCNNKLKILIRLNFTCHKYPNHKSGLRWKYFIKNSHKSLTSCIWKNAYNILKTQSAKILNIPLKVSTGVHFLKTLQIKQELADLFWTGFP